ncbi:RagB/SusD family nutrient uptake outer membrane protein [Chryseobacterium chendengshani]|uniref:RagB/SusD family nutrient uptake outer membrane protein n=1 Tax=Chryseobacterium sp. LJ756 TaxID=2864113 RepID=UPI001C63D8A6|nr:RagB/SusD family nutrient uptake outer membrane protein [Chryseobacterium sp. LJ756]MBW7675636.1 RagB/SusD family nutrient uptake outer membrane protein [Chryseobacterium sp. LJ756]
MKKYINKVFVLAIAATLTVSCKDAYEIVQDGEIYDETIFRTTSDLDRYLTGSVYTSLDNTSEIKFTSVFTDEVSLGPSNTGQDIGLHRYVLNANSGYAASTWLTHYTTINRVNRLIRASSQIPAPTNAQDQVTFNNVLAEARAIRAFAYISLQSYFSTNMKDDNALGVILSNTVPDINDQLPRSTNGAIWSFVEADLQFAFDNINPQWQLANNHSSHYFMTKKVISALRARMYTYRGNYTLAKQYALDVIATAGVPLTPSTPNAPGVVGSATWNNVFYNAASNPNPYRRMWTDTAPGESIFSLSRPASGIGTNNIASLYTTNTTTLTGSPLFVFGLNLFAELTSNTNDIRRYAFIDPTSDVANKIYVIDKYPGKGVEPLKNDIKIIRLSEIYLILAECEAQTNLTNAATYVKAVRDARKYTGTATLPVYGNKQQALRDILKERRVELCFEGHRYVDLRRLGQEAGVSIDRNPLDDIVSSTPLTLPITDFRFTLPIPSAEINGNPTIQQNPGY